MVPVGINAASYTPLESLLFFQALRSQDLSSIDFQAVSDDLVTVPLVKQDAAFDHTRLTPEALQALYSDLVIQETRDQSRSDVQPVALTNGHSTPDSKKRKASSPSLPSAELAAKRADLFPKLLFKLYARYRQNVLGAVKEEERMIAALDKEIEELENGQIRADAVPSAVSANEQREKGAEPVVQSSDLSVDTSMVDAEEEDPECEPAPAIEIVPSAKASMEGQSAISTPPTVQDAPQSKATTTVLDAPPLTATVPAPMGRPSSLASPKHKQVQTPILPQPSPPLPHGSPYQLSPRQTVSSPLHQGANAQTKSAESAISQRPSQPNGLNIRQSPILPNGFAPMQPPPHRGMQIQPQQYNPAAFQQSPSQAKQAGRGYAGPVSPYPNHYPFPYPPPQQHQQTHQPQPQQNQPRPSQLGGVQLPPFSVSAQEPVKDHHQAQQPQPTQSQSAPQQPQASPQRMSLSNPYTPFTSLPSTPQAQSSARKTSGDPDLVNSVIANLRKRRSTSTWRHMDTPPLFPPRSPPRPAIEPISPVRRAVKPAKPTAQDASEAQAEGDATDANEAIEPTGFKDKPSTQRKAGRKTRGSSVASSTAAATTRGRTRSQSVVSQLDRGTTPAAPTTEGRTVKNEPSTPFQPSKQGDTLVPRSTRTRRGTLQATPATATATRRTPHGTPRAETHVDEKHVIATRNFQRLSAVILNEISAHRHAGPFQKPVSSRDVEGYADIIKMPQDLKSIKAMISAGSRAVSAALAAGAIDEEGGGAGTGASIVLPRSDALMPPKGIVNSAQLEQEVMRMFANAVLFNPGDEGFVQDAREMAEDVAAKIQNWRGIESSGGDRAEEEGGGGGKRRKL